MGSAFNWLAQKYCEVKQMVSQTKDAEEVECPGCNDIADLSMIDVSLRFPEGEVSFPSPGYRCQDCGVEFFSKRQSERVDLTAEKLRTGRRQPSTSTR